MIFIQRHGSNIETVRKGITDILARGYEITYIEVGKASLISQIKSIYPPDVPFLQSYQDPHIVNIVCLKQVDGKTIVQMICTVKIDDN